MLRPGGRLAAATNSRQHLHEVWTAVGDPDYGFTMPFRAEDAAQILGTVFPAVECRLVCATVTFADRDAVRPVRRASFNSERAEKLPPFDGPSRRRARRQRSSVTGAGQIMLTVAPLTASGHVHEASTVGLELHARARARKRVQDI